MSYNVYMAKDEFIKLFNYMTERFDWIDQTLDTKADSANLQKVSNTLDRI
jgi:hypothetical protein